ncbi:MULTISPECIES: flagellar biosynthesis protein FliQ [Limnochorda]|uniref:flagellar biosynthesis protein FliQ n=1 Tax=Limnochorda TaxID=1676651 RepID=UPI001D383ECC|nr:flagellar biosynthesis protein FliQ [Limnochorda pilosa]MBO2485891.1 flagellar biosynthetic protein FliQ [Bacillota bacterium]MBO2518944.1 flagellar biosynthetic protein FliQ [Bacillota bacterium]
MNAGVATDLAREAVQTILLAAGPILLAALVVGVVVSLLQAVTQIQEQTLAFVPKIVAVLTVVFLAGSWMFGRITDFAVRLLGNLDRFIG